MNKGCKYCGENARKYNEDADAYYCEGCDNWLENECTDERCEYCRKRASKPTESIKLTIHPPEGTSFGECSKCAMPMVYDGTSEECILCTLMDL